MANKPLILSDNLLDDVVLHRDHIVSTSGTEVAGSELFNIADNLRDVTRFTVSETNNTLDIIVDCGVAKEVDAFVLDRGHNLAGKSFQVHGGSDGVTFADTILNANIPATAGGLGSDANGCLTPDGGWWKRNAGT